ncbi:MAG: GIY-YIG nuclease family protein [Chloroflexota bacterium]|jgi:putative endonuclease
MAYFCYIVECSDGSYYTGWSTDPYRRERQHNRGKGARYTRQHLPVRLVYIEEQPTRQAAMRREAALKKLAHNRKKQLIAISSPESTQCNPT